MDIKEKIKNILKKHLDDALICTREWSAWGYGTMTEDDFENISDVNINDISNDIVDAINKPITNADAIRNMTDEELFDFMCEIRDSGINSAVSFEWGNVDNTRYDFEVSTDWLKEIKKESV
jgi:hypothetical protein